MPVACPSLIAKIFEATFIGVVAMTGNVDENSWSGVGEMIGASGDEELSGEGTIDIAAGSKFSFKLVPETRK